MAIKKELNIKNITTSDLDIYYHFDDMYIY